MILYTCDTCKKEFNIKRLYNNHLLRKNPCILLLNNECIYCEKKFSNKSNLTKHIKNCKKIIDDNNKLQIEELKKFFEKKFDEQQKKIDELSHLSETNKNITVNDNTIINNTTNNIIIYNVGKEDLSRLSQEEIIKICTSGTYYPLVAVEIIHCNEKYPEFQNFIISNLRSNDGLIRINDKWESKSHDEILSTLLKVDKNHVSSLMKDIIVDNKLQVRLESTKDEIDTNESKEHQKIKIKRKLYNASKMILENKKNNEKGLKK